MLLSRHSRTPTRSWLSPSMTPVTRSSLEASTMTSRCGTCGRTSSPTPCGATPTR
ncbi:putative U5 snRNP-specific 40 kDa protein [Taeniopygia guttata]|uniref:Putative U5 snRNP-specific 40 kDa protein n=1 Tax=Taeniopygia guttata TaxID=59729 RepID=B5G0G7_TAEGU|nr:putative U5 snRNP-specific 40 kDa protein [Taeniopygia guttata]ACH44778.1 putative U5 snRNP-specific 40 kDa protein [Taeniopygia guttata]